MASAAATAGVTQVNAVQVRGPGCQLVSGHISRTFCSQRHRFMVRMGLEIPADDATAATKSAAAKNSEKENAEGARVAEGSSAER